MDARIENAIRSLQQAFDKIADATEYSVKTNTWGKADTVLCGIAQDLHAAWESLAAQANLDPTERPDLALNRLAILKQAES